ncbi:MAG: NUDIX hydrolase [Hespellia sp.]|nr:NUDIX hydrolase [Hespellia sp.]
MKKIPILNSMKKTRNTPYLKNYTLNYTNSLGNEKIYEMVSNFDHECLEDIGKQVSGVAIAGRHNDQILLCKEFRMGVNQFVYNLPAGHIDEGEDAETCARRELYEETGLSILKILDILPPSYAAPDFSDILSWTVFAEVDGEFSDHTGADEWIEPGFYTRTQAAELLKTSKFTIRAQLITHSFIHEVND